MNQSQVISSSTVFIGRGLLCMLFLAPMLLVNPLSSAAQTYEIRFTNRTPQVLTTPVCAIHTKRAGLFKLGEEASDGLKVLAEDGDESTFLRETRNTKGVRSTATGGFVFGGENDTINIKSNRRGRLSCVFGMLVVTNDGFPALRNQRLPRQVGQSRKFRARAYDAGTEQNTESCDHVPGGPCDAHFVGLAENGTVQVHPGIIGDADVSASRFGWTGPAVRGTITRIE